MPGTEDGFDVLFLDTLLRYYMHIDPGALCDEQWAWTIRYLYDIRKAEARNNREG
ncbi:MAG: hypothetical protein IJ782_02025 [Prevotella sp.]|nr:hypothetical protein [Prevotella sp.]